MRVLDAFWPGGATWSGQVISSPLGPSGGPSKMHLLPGGGVPRVHRARSPVPPRLPRFASPWSVHQFAAVAAGAYPPRHPPNAWSPGAPALPGPCYWLLASGNPLGSEAALPSGWGVSQCATTALAGAVPRPCVRGAGGRFGGLGPVPGVVSLPFAPSRPACPALPVAGRPVRVSLTLARRYAIPRGLGVPRAPVALLVVPACPLRVCALALPRRLLPPPLGGVACAPRAVPALGAGRAVPCGPYPSACAAPVSCSVWRARGGAVRSWFLPTWLGVHALWGLRAGGVVGGRLRGGVACDCCEARLVSGAVPPPTARLLRRAAGVPRPVCPGCDRCGRGDPGSVPQRAPLRAGIARRGGGGRASPGGGAFHRCEGRLRSGAPPPPTSHPLGGLLGSVTHMLWARVCGCGGPSLPLWPACPVGAACRGAGRGCPRRGGAATVLRDVWCQALSLPLPPVLSGGRPGSRDLCVRGAVGAGVGTQRRPHSVRPCGPTLLAVGVAEGRPRGGCPPPL